MPRSIDLRGEDAWLRETGHRMRRGRTGSGLASVWMLALVACVFVSGASVLPLTTYAQGPLDAGLRGRVLARGGSALAVELELSTAEGVTVAEVHPGQDGAFLLLRLAPGSYVLRGRASAPTGAFATSEAVELQAGEIADVTLELVPVLSPASGGAAPAASMGRGAELDESANTLPVSMGGFASLAELELLGNGAAPAAANDSGASDDEQPEQQSSDGRVTSADGAAAAGLSEAGLAATQDHASVDGLTAMQYFRAGPRGAAAGGAASTSSFAQGAVGRFQRGPDTYSAVSGGAGGASTSVATRRGGAALHGTGFAMLREGGWSATNPFSVVTHYSHGVVTNSLARPGGAVALLGGSAGAAVPRLGTIGGSRGTPRVFAFGAVEAQISRDQLTSTPQLASFYELTPTQSTLLAVRGVSSLQTQKALNYLDSLTGVLHRSGLRINSFGRVDAAVSSRDSLTLTYAGHRLSAPAGTALGQSSDAVVARGLGSVGDRTVDVDAVAGHWLHRLGSRMDNEAAAQWTHELNEEQPRAPLPQEPAIGPGGYAPEVRIAPNGFAYGTPASLGRSAYPEETRVEATEMVSLRAGSHLLRAGVAWSRVEDRLDSATNADGTFSYDSGTVDGYAGGLVDWISDYTYNVHAYPNGACPSVYATTHFFCFHTFTQSFGPQQLDFAVHQVAAFAEDSWRPREDLRLTLGARYEYTLLPFAQRPNFALDAAIATLGRSDAGATATMPEDRNNVGPRLSVVWAPRFGVLRRAWFTAQANYGVFYGRTPGGTIAAALTDTALTSSIERVRIRPTTITQCPQVTTSQGFGYPCDYTSAPPAAVAQTTSAVVLSGHFREPAIQRGSLTLEHEFGRKVWVRAGYAMALATQLPTSTDLNISPSATTAAYVLQGGDGRAGVRDGEIFHVPLYTTRPIVSYGAITLVESHANASFHAGTLEAGVRGWRGLTAHGSFAFSKAIDYGAQQGATPRRNAQFDPFSIGYDRGLSSLNFPERFSGAVEYRTSREGAGSGRGWQRGALAEWTLGAIAVAGSGAPYSYGIYGGRYLSGGGDSINGSGGAVYLPTVGRNTLRLPTRSRVDVRLTREVRLPRAKVLEAFAQAFNVANMVSVSRVETRAFLVGTQSELGEPTPLIFQDAATVASEGIQTPAFGAALSSTTGLSRERQIELGVRVRF